LRLAQIATSSIKSQESWKSLPKELLFAEVKESVTVKLVEYGYRAASRKYPDRGGVTAIMQTLNAAREFASERLKN